VLHRCAYRREAIAEALAQAGTMHRIGRIVAGHGVPSLPMAANGDRRGAFDHFD
jgi:hypothetical protein